jgi:Zn-dependent protease with chaperone function
MAEFRASDRRVRFLARVRRRVKLHSVSKRMTSFEKPATWITFRRWIQIVLLGMVAAWWALWDLRGESIVSRLVLHLPWIDAALPKVALFWMMPIGIAVVVQSICYSLDRAFMERRWTTSDVLRLVFWRTVSPTVALLLVAIGFDAIYDRRLVGVLWLVAAAIAAIVGTARLRSAEGMKLQRVKSGELYKRAFVMAKNMQTPLKRVYVVPAGRGHLTNAYGLSESIAVTDNYGKFLNSAQLDFVIGHELGHVKEKHGRKKLLLFGVVYAILAVTCFFLPSAFAPVRPLLDICAIFAPTLAFYFLSRRFEYAADRASVEFTQAPKAAIHALANLYRFTQAPTYCDRVTELFMTHPAFVRRAWAIGEVGRMPSERLSEIIDESQVREVAET